MLKIFNNLSPFFEYNYREISVREYSRIIKISAPTASTVLKKYAKEGLLISKQERNHILYRLNRQSYFSLDLQKAYYRIKLNKLVEYLTIHFNYCTIILFGSLIKGETIINSDIDLFINTTNKDIILSKFEKKFNRKIQLHFKSELRNKNLENNIKLGIVLHGSMI